MQLLSNVSHLFQSLNARQISFALMKIYCNMWRSRLLHRSRSFQLSIISSSNNCLFVCIIFKRFLLLGNSGNRVEQLGTPYKKGKPCTSCQQACHTKIKLVNLKLFSIQLLIYFNLIFRLCVNSCNAADLWANCRELYKTWPGWLCRTNTTEGLQRQHNCLATCNCQGKIHDWAEYGNMFHCRDVPKGIKRIHFKNLKETYLN